MLYDNGLKDTGFAQIIEGISCLKTVNSLTYFGNEIGMESIEKLEDLAWEDEKKALKDLRIGYLKTSSKCLLELFGLIERLAYLKKLRISGFKLTDNIYCLPLQNIVTLCKSLVDINLSDCSLTA